ncbi:MAG: LLM class flavin-dependent oxidoreductase [Gammaproteobacteria bacterium]|nr:LLM class flavin-dependent oxidoreductase [Gammaproteobacteria bacterium]MYF30937.1 LLM class flavin-dependent oxidoreductase [Gammaproteobacteria bacterium]MYK46388.1 LLM class flavin-dependent oxidoreductase [Gammaproteobacteria bacterium]
MDVGLLTFCAAKPGESQEECYAATFNEIVCADEMGWDTVWTGGVPLRGNVSHPLFMAAAIAGRTRRIKIGTAVHLPHLRTPGERFTTDVPEGASRIDRRGPAGEAYRYVFEHMPPADPIQVAEQIAMIDQVSNGRFIYGAGGNTIGDQRRQRHFLEFLAVMKQAWTEEAFSGFQGEFYDYPALPEGSEVLPKPVQKPHPPILLPLDSQQSFVPMGRGGYRIAIGGGTSHNERGDAVLREDVGRYRQAWRNAGHPGDPKVVIRISTYVAATHAEVNRAMGRTDGSDLTGTPEQVIDRIHELQEDFGADEIMCTMLGRALSRDDILRSIRLMADKVIPRVR